VTIPHTAVLERTVIGARKAFFGLDCTRHIGCCEMRHDLLYTHRGTSMNAVETPQAEHAVKPTNESDNDPIAVPDRLMVAMFLIVGGMLGIIIVLDLFLGFFR